MKMQLRFMSLNINFMLKHILTQSWNYSGNAKKSEIMYRNTVIGILCITIKINYYYQSHTHCKQAIFHWGNAELP